MACSVSGSYKAKLVLRSAARMDKIGLSCPIEISRSLYPQQKSYLGHFSLLVIRYKVS